MKWYEHKKVKKSIYIFAFILTTTLLVLWITNPSLGKGYQAYKSSTSRSFFSQIVDAVPFGIQKSFCKADFYLFSVYAVKYSSFGKEALVPVSYGVLGMVFSLNSSEIHTNPLETLDKLYQANKWLEGRLDECRKF